MEEKQTKKEQSKSDYPKSHLTLRRIKSKSLFAYSAVILVTVLIIGVVIYNQKFSVAAEVNGTSISRSSVIKALEDEAGAGVLDSMISDILIEQAATEAGVTVTDTDVESEIKAIETQIAEQGGTLEDVLAQQGMSRKSLVGQIRTQKLLEILLSEDIAVTQEDIDAFIESNGPLPEEQEDMLRLQIEEQIRSQKLSTAAQSYITGLRTQATIKYFVDYK